MSADESLQSTVDRLLGSVRGQLEASLRTQGEELARAAAAERARAVAQATDEARRQAQEELTELREAARRENDDLRTSAESQIAELRRMLDEIRRSAQEQLDTARKTLDTEVAAVRAKADADVEDARRLATSQVDDIQRQMNDRLPQVTRELEQTRGELASAQRHAEDARQHAARESDDPLAGRLADAIVSLDESRSLGDVLERLTPCAVQSVDRAALLMVNGDRLREWRTIGFGERTSGQTIDLRIDDAGLVGAAAREGRAATRIVGEDAVLPAFAASDSGARDAIALPITVAGAVVAVLYADGTNADAGRVKESLGALEIVARHAGRVLEAITVRQAVGLLPLHPTARASHGPGQPRSGSVQ